MYDCFSKETILESESTKDTKLNNVNNSFHAAPVVSDSNMQIL